jgi:hypothetical protein
VCLQLSELAAAAAAAAAAAQNGAVTSPTGMPQQGQNSPPIPATPAVQEQSRLVAESSSTSTVQHPQALTSYTTTATPLSVSKEAPSGSGKGMSTLRHALCAAACIAFPDPAPGSTACLLLAVTAAGCGHAGQDAGWWEVYEGAARDVHRRYAQALAAQAAASGQPPGSGATLPPLEVLVGSTQHAQHVAADMWPLFTVHSSGRSCFAMNAGALLQAAAKAVEEGVEDEVGGGMMPGGGGGMSAGYLEGQLVLGNSCSVTGFKSLTDLLSDKKARVVRHMRDGVRDVL